MSNWIESVKMLAQIPAARAHVERLRNQIETIESERDKLAAESNRLNAENIELKRRIEAKVRAAEFEKFDGVLWKRRPDGEVDASPHCPHCKTHPRMIPFPSFDPQLEWICSICRFSVGTGAVRPPR